MQKIKVNNTQRQKLHNKRACFDVRDDKESFMYIHAVKFRVGPHRGHFKNRIDHAVAHLQVNPVTRRDNTLLLNQTTPFHLLTYGCGPDTFYHGRYVCTGKNKAKTHFILRYQDCGDVIIGTKRFRDEDIDSDSADNVAAGNNACHNPSDIVLPLSNQEKNAYRSRLELTYARYFTQMGLTVVHEPATFDISEAGKPQYYTPDFYIVDHAVWVEIKGPRPNENELDKCKKLNMRGFKIILLHGNSPSNPECWFWKYPKQQVYTRDRPHWYMRMSDEVKFTGIDMPLLSD